MSRVPRDPPNGSGPEPPERRWDAGAGAVDPDDPALLARLGIVIPDDVSSLAVRRSATSRLLHGGHDGPVRAPRKRAAQEPRPRTLALLVSLVLLVGTVALAGSLLAVITPDAPVTTPGTYSLAADPPGEPGEVGGLLPDTGLTIDDDAGTSARELRPAVLFLPPAGECPTCAAALADLGRQTREYGIGLFAVAPLDRADAARELLRTARAGRAHIAIDPAGALTAAYGAGTSTTVLVHADGVVAALIGDHTAGDRLEPLLSPLRLPGAPPGLRPAATAD